jgi:hypothetical protein
MNSGLSEGPTDSGFAVFESPSGAKVVFEVDNETEYLYAVGADGSIEEAVMIGRAQSTAESGQSQPTVVWSADGQVAKVQVVSKIVAVFHFANRQLYSLSRFPPAQRWQFVEQSTAQTWLN